MTPGLGIEVIEFAHENDRKLYRACLEAVASFRKVRPVFLERQPRAERNPFILGTLKRPELAMIADNLIRHWLLEKHGPMLGEFLTSLGIENTRGMVEQLPPQVEEAPLRSAVNLLLAKYPAETVAVYLNAFNQFNQAGWSNLDDLLKNDSRLQVGAAGQG
ncbi:MAG TPA: hypothetical protein DCM86_06495 [Verrucomicrobiales bacterium]|nr:hypothetical protein [Verrucomicrobiales bacterium]